jgi:unsaturated chondroitin disaccharide hydrolase
MDNSTWSRGQAWCVYGFTTAYRYTGDAEFLATAERCADYFVAALPRSQPSDGVPLWDFDWPGGGGYADRDSLAGAIGARGLAQLGGYTADAAKAKAYAAAAAKAAGALVSGGYLGASEQNAKVTAGVVLHSTGSYMAHSEVDTSIVYGGYFLAELLRFLSPPGSSGEN